MAEALVTNNAVGTLSSSITDSDLTLTLNSGQGALFPNPTGGNYFWATILTDANEKEIVKVTARATNTLTIVRAQQSTTARAFDAGDRVELRFTAGHHELYGQTAKTNVWSIAQSFITGTFITGAAASTREFLFKTSALARWGVGVTNDAESTADAGSNFFVKSYDDAGAAKTTLFKINRATGAITNSSNNKFDAFPAATGIVFYQTAAPTGWTISNINDKALRVVNATGGVTGGTTAFSSVFGARTIAEANLPSHTHTVSGSSAVHAHSGSVTSAPTVTVVTNVTGSGIVVTTGSAVSAVGTGSSGNAQAVLNFASQATGGGTAMDFAVQYASCIICTKDA